MLSEFIEDFCISAAIMKGPVITKKGISWQAGMPIVKEDFLLNKRVNPIDVYPDPSGSCAQR